LEAHPFAKTISTEPGISNVSQTTNLSRRFALFLCDAFDDRGQWTVFLRR